ncbi:transposase, Ptta/En/Spm, transposase, Tnp1/En/Spm-like protein [Tanacetum coccineum]
METQAIDDQDPLVNYDNDNENDDLGYQSEEYFDEVQEDDENNHSNRNVVKRGITRLYKFRREYRKPDGIKLSVTFDALNRISRKHRALFLTFLGDMRYFDVDLTVRKLVMNRLGQLLRNFRRKLRQTYILPNQNTLSKLNEVPAKYSAILQAEEWVNFVKYTATEEYKVKSAAAKMARSKSVYQHTMGRGGYALVKEKMLKGRVNKDEEYPDDEIRSLGDKLKETKDKIKKGTLKVDHGTDAMTIVLGKEKGGYVRGVGSRVTYKRYFDLPRGRQASDERILLLQSQLDNERRECQEKELLIHNLSNKMSQIEGMVTKLKNQLAVHEGQSQSMSTQLTPPNVSPVDINPIKRSADEEGRTTVFRCKNDANIQKSNGLATLEKEMETRVSNKTFPCETVTSVRSKKMTRSIRKDSSRQASQSQENVSPLLVLLQAIKCKLWHLKKSTIIALGTVYKTDGKQMLHNKELPKDCYKVSIDTSLVDAACIPDVGNNGFKTVKDAVGGFFAWPKDLVVFDPKATPPSTIQMNVENKTAPKLQTKRKNVYVSSDAMQRQAKKKSIHKSLNY